MCSWNLFSMAWYINITFITNQYRVCIIIPLRIKITESDVLIFLMITDLYQQSLFGSPDDEPSIDNSKVNT